MFISRVYEAVLYDCRKSRFCTNCTDFGKCRMMWISLNEYMKFSISIENWKNWLKKRTPSTQNHCTFNVMLMCLLWGFPNFTIQFSRWMNLLPLTNQSFSPLIYCIPMQTRILVHTSIVRIAHTRQIFGVRHTAWLKHFEPGSTVHVWSGQMSCWHIPNR